MERERRDASLITAVGVLISAAPPLWSWLWGGPDADAVGWIFVFGLSIPPFLLAAGFRRTRRLSRAGAVVATLVAGALVVLGQVLALNPHEESSTAVLGLLIGPLYGLPAVAAICGLEALLRATRNAWRARQRPAS